MLQEVFVFGTFDVLVSENHSADSIEVVPDAYSYSQLFMLFDAGLIGLAISYSLAVTGLLSGVVNAFTETEKEMIAVERACQYIEEVESEQDQEVLFPPYAWPSQGVVTFNNVVLKYR
jgi:ABC-type multidrug transport system fused ATPase/permease subunit